MESSISTQPGGISSVEVPKTTAIKSLTEHVSRLHNKALETGSELSNLKFRLLNLGDDQEPESDAPEPVRQDVEDLAYRLQLLEAALDAIYRHTSDLQRL